MTTNPSRRLRAALLAVLLGTVSPSTPAEILAAFDFDDGAGGFDPDPQLLHAALEGAAFSAAGLTDFAGNPGRALAASGFVSGNPITLTLSAAPAHLVTAARLSLELRASASGPAQWRATAAGAVPVTGATSTDFEPIAAELSGALPASTVQLVLEGLDAASDGGTLRLDNVLVEGTVQPVPVPTAGLLAALPAACCMVLGRRLRAAGRATPASRRRSENTGPA